MEGLLEILGETNLAAFLFTTFVMFGFCSWMTGQAVANAWRPTWYIGMYAILLGAGDRFMSWALFQADIISPTGFVIDVVIAYAIVTVAHRITLARKMVTQYPWLYERDGLFAWRKKPQA